MGAPLIPRRVVLGALLVAAQVCWGGKPAKHERTALQSLHIPKNAGATIEIWWRRDAHPKTTISRCRMSPWHTPPRFMDPNLYVANSTFCILRDPVDHLVSEYKMIHRSGDLLEGSRGSQSLNRWIGQKAGSVEDEGRDDPELPMLNDCHLPRPTPMTRFESVSRGPRGPIVLVVGRRPPPPAAPLRVGRARRVHVLARPSL